jgi:hypothetical protein
MRPTFAIVVFACLSAWPIHPLLEAQADRQLLYNPGVAISTLIRPGDRRVRMDWEPPPLMGFFPGDIPAADLLQAHAMDAQAILVVKIEKKAPHLTQQADWIKTTYETSIVEHLRPREPIGSPNLRIDLNGGTLEIRGVTVTANAAWEPRIAVGSRYLLFVNKMGDPVDGIWAYKVGDKELLESTWNAFYFRKAADNIHGMPLAEARSVILKGTGK